MGFKADVGRFLGLISTLSAGLCLLLVWFHFIAAIVFSGVALVLALVGLYLGWHEEARRLPIAGAITSGAVFTATLWLLFSLR